MQGPGGNPPHGWFNPQGDGTWRLLGCAVTSAWLPSGQVTSDSVLQCIVADSDMQAPAKLVDLDPEQQLVSEIWGMQVRIADSNGNTLMRGDFEAVAFIDIWNRATGKGSDIAAGAMYQSVLTNLWWGDVSGSTFLATLRNARPLAGQAICNSGLRDAVGSQRQLQLRLHELVDRAERLLQR